MDFRWNLNHFLKRDIVKVDNSLLPQNFRGDKLTFNSCLQAMSEVIDAMGIASAKAQGLRTPITSADRLRNSDYILYVLFDPEGNMGNGSVVGMLKMGRKRLYVFNNNGDCHDKVSLCVLDFYVHESRQRQGCGKQLFDFMLKEEKISPEKIAIDRPSDKFISFLLRHYGLKHIIPQNNNFVVFDGFFPSKSLVELPDKKTYITKRFSDSPSNSPGNSVTYNGRHSAHKPETTIGKCLNWYPVEGAEDYLRFSPGIAPHNSVAHLLSYCPSP